MLPFSSSVSRRLAFLHRIARGSLLRLPRYYQDAPTSRRPSRPIRCSFIDRYRIASASKRGVAVGRLLFGTAPVPRSSRFDRAGERRDLPGSCTVPSRTCSALRPRRTSPLKPITMGAVLPSLLRTRSAPPHSNLSGLNHTACSLAVYASQLGLLRSTPRKTRFSLTATLGEAGLEPAGLFSKVSLSDLNSFRFDPPSPGLSWRTRQRWLA